MSYQINVFRNSFTKRFSESLGKHGNDYCFLLRTAKSGKPTFALAWDNGGSTFPQPVTGLSDVPMGALKERMDLIIRGARYARKGGLKNQTEEQLLRLGEATLPVDPADSFGIVRNRIQFLKFMETGRDLDAGADDPPELFVSSGILAGIQAMAAEEAATEEVAVAVE